MINSQKGVSYKTNSWPPSEEYINEGSFIIVPGLSGTKNTISLQANRASKYGGQYVTINGNLSGSCAKQLGKEARDVVFEANPADPKKASWYLAEYNYSLSSSTYFGCGNGRTEDINLVDGISKMWMASYSPNTVNSSLLQKYNVYSLIMDEKEAFNGNQFQRINFSKSLSNVKTVGIANYGLLCQLGMYFVENKDYNGYLYLKTLPSQITDIKLQISLQSAKSDILAMTVITVAAKNTKWMKYNFSLIPNKNSTCSQDNRGYFGCDGSLRIELTNIGDIVDIDYVYMEPGKWGRFNNLPIKKDIADLFVSQNILSLRNGGSMCNNDGYRWKLFRGDRDLRAPYHGNWYYQYNLSASRGFGMFELIDFCAEIGCRNIITINNNETSQDMMDFVEYCFGDNTTKYGKLRIETDNHPDRYYINWIEIGNEQKNLTTLLPQILNITKAMNDKVEELNTNKQTYNGLKIPMFNFVIGYNLQYKDMQPENNLNEIINYLQSLSFLEDRIFWDMHSQQSMPKNAQTWVKTIDLFQSICNQYNSRMRVVMFEENGGDDMGKALGHALYRQLFISKSNFAVMESGGVLGHPWQGRNFEATGTGGNIIFLPNGSFPRPVYYVNVITNKTYEPFYMFVDGEDNVNNFNVSAVGNNNKFGVNSDTMNITIYFVNWSENDVDVDLRYDGLNGYDLNIMNNGEIRLSILQSPNGDMNDSNYPYDPFNIVTKYKTINDYVWGQALTIDKYSYVAAQMSVQLN